MDPPSFPLDNRKRGRPLSQSIGDAAQDRQRQLARERKQRQYERERQRRTPATATQLTQTDIVLAQERTIMDIDPTVVDLGLRVLGLKLATDPQELDTQADLVPTPEDFRIYIADDSMAESQVPTEGSRVRREDPVVESPDNIPVVLEPDRRTPDPVEASPVDIDDIADGDQAANNQRITPSTRLTIDPKSPTSLPARARQASTPLSPSIRHVYDISSSHTPTSHHSQDPSRAPSEHRSTRDWSSTIEEEEAYETTRSADNSTHEESGSSEDDEEYEASPTTIVAEKIRQLLQNDFPGCSHIAHSTALQEHHDKVTARSRRARCTPLDNAFNDDTFPSVLSDSKKFLSPEDYRSSIAPTPEQWYQMFSGVGKTVFPDHVCLHATSHSRMTAEHAFDIDSYLGFASSLAFAKNGIKYQPVPQIRQNIQTDVHVTLDIPRDDGRERDEDEVPPMDATQLRKIPHFMIGSMIGCESDHVGIYILFPEIGTRGKEFYSLTHEQHTFWMNRIFLPSVVKCLPSHFAQHLPGDFRHAHSNSYANQVESRLSATQSYLSQQGIGYNIPAHALVEIWEEILNKIATVRGGAIFQNAQIFFSAKGVKLAHKGFGTRRDLLSTLDRFMTQFERTFDTTFLYPDRVFVDIGKETCPSKTTDNEGENPGFSPTSDGVHHEVQLAYALLWKRCCLDNMMHHLWDGEPPSSKSKGRQFYSVSMLHDAANLTSLPKKTSQLRQGGLAYMQLYSSVKEVIDAAKQYPFQNDGLEELALDPKIRKAAQSTAKSAKRDARILENAYQFSKARLHHAINASAKKSFGVRQEYRCTFELLRRLIEILKLQDEQAVAGSEATSETTPVYDVRNPTYVWTLPTRIYLDFLRRNADKFATGFEWVRAQALSRRPGVSWESTKIMAMFLRCLRFSLGGHDLSRERALWWGKAQKTDPSTGTMVQRVGLGFSHTLEQYGYCWIQPRIDWSLLCFKSDVTSDILFGNSLLRQAYQRRGGNVGAFFDLIQQVHLALEFMADLQDHPVASQQVLEWMAQTVLRQFRRDVLESITSDLRPQFSEREAVQELLVADDPFCYDWIMNICRPERVNILRTQRVKFNTPVKLFEVLFSDGTQIRRETWNDKAFRALYKQCRGGLQDLKLYDEERDFVRLLRNSLVRWHWLLPYPHHRGLTETNKNKDGDMRNWYSVDISHDRVAKGTPLESVRIEDWVQLNQKRRAGEPEPLPDFVEWDMAQWRAWKAQIEAS